MDSLTQWSDTLLRPDIALVLPALSAHARSYPLLLLSTSLLHAKWASGCGCFTQLCARKRAALRNAPLYLALCAALYACGVAPDAPPAVALAAVLALLTRESGDTRALKATFMLAAYALPTPLALAACAAAAAAYARATGWRVRAGDGGELLASNDVWLVTRDGRLAKRVNNKGEFHLEYAADGETMLVGDGRLVGRGDGVMSGLRREGFAEMGGANVAALERILSEGRAVEKEGVVSFVM